MKYYIICLIFFNLLNKIFSDNIQQYLFSKKNIFESIANYTKIYDYKLFNKTKNYIINNEYIIDPEFSKIIPFILNNI